MAYVNSLHQEAQSEEGAAAAEDHTVDFSHLHPIVQQIKPSAEQIGAVLARGQDVLVSAGAGTGKTRTLTARILSLLAEGVPLRAIVAVTFTIKAASEMRNRLRAEIQSYLQRADLPPAEYTHWSRIAAEMDAARIGTIHSLCAEILRAHPAEAAIDPLFGVLEEGPAALLQRDAADEALARALTEPEAMPLLRALGVQSLHTLLLELLNQRLAASTLFDESFATRARAALGSLHEGVARFMADAEVAGWIEEVRRALRHALANERAAADKITPFLQPLLDAWQRTQDALHAGDRMAALRAAQHFGSLPVNSGNKTNWKQYFPKPAFANLRATFNDCVPLPEKANPALDMELLALLPHLRTLYQHALTHLTAAKADLRALDFDDLEQGAHDLLVAHASVRADWQQQVQSLLVDEFQDTNQRQRDLLAAIAGDRGIFFMVGDAKQSIYRFRGADVRVFRRERDAVQARGGLASQLAASFRAQPNLLAQLNTLMRAALGDEEEATQEEWREPFAPLHVGNSARRPLLDTPAVELHLGVGSKKDGVLRFSAEGIAQRLHQLHAAGIPWDHMALLARATTAFQTYEDVFERAGIPFVTVAGRGFHDRPEVRDLLNALRALADPTDNLALYGLLRSPIIGFADADLLALYADVQRAARTQDEQLPADSTRQSTPTGAWWQALQMQAAANNTGRAATAVEVIAELHARVGRVSAADLLKHLLDRSHYEAALIDAGMARAARNVGKLLEDAQASPQMGVSDFLEMVSEMRMARARESEARADASGALQIMTVHAAKGLEFPVVVLGDLAGGGRGGRSKLLLSDETGVLVDMRDDENRHGVLYQQAMARESEMEEAESRRLLYVAGTRAREVLLLSAHIGFRKEGAPSLGGWLGTIADALDLDECLHALPLNTEQPAHIVLNPHATCTVYSAPPPAFTPLPPTTVAADESAAHEPLPFNPARIAPLPSATDRPKLPARTWQVVPPTPRPQPPPWVVGKVLHFAMEVDLDLDNGFAEWVRWHAATMGVTNEAQLRAAARRVKALLTLYRQSALHDEVANAVIVYRELPYAAMAPVQPPPAVAAEPVQAGFFEEVAPAQQASPPPAHMESGTIDLLYQRGDGAWVVVDFKVDRLRKGSSTSEYLASKPLYREQLQRYGRAVQQLTGATPQLRLCLLDEKQGLTLIEVEAAQ